MQKLSFNVFNVLIHDLNVTWKRHSNQLLSLPSDSIDYPVGDGISTPVPQVVEWPLVINPDNTICDDVSVDTGVNAESDSSAVPLRRSIRNIKPPVRLGFT